MSSMWMFGRCPVERAFESRGHAIVGGFIGTRQPGGRHGARAQLLKHFFPEFGVFAGLVHFGRVKGDPAGLQLAVMAGNAILLEHGARGRRLRTARSGKQES